MYKKNLDKIMSAIFFQNLGNNTKIFLVIMKSTYINKCNEFKITPLNINKFATIFILSILKVLI